MAKYTGINDTIEAEFKEVLGEKLRIEWQKDKIYSTKFKVDLDCFYSDGNINIMAEIYVTIGKVYSAKKRKLMSDCFKMLALEKMLDQKFEKYIVTVEDDEWCNGIKKTWQYKALLEMGIHWYTVKISDSHRNELSDAIFKAGANFRKKMHCKIILSRKGFDSTAGGITSPVVNNRFISLPIPQKSSELKYKSLQFGQSGIDLYSAIKQLGFKQSDECHMDPNLTPEEYGLDKKEGWMPAFGQHNAAASHLNNNKIGEGDIFLFFGRYRHAQIIGSKIQYKDKKDFHAIFGFMEVGKVIRIEEATENDLNPFRNHPHVLKRHNGLYAKNSSLYIPAEISKHGFPSTVGSFEFSTELVLSEPNKTIREWKLPQPFHGKNFTYGLNVDKNGIGTSPARGQELISDAKPEIIEWIRKILKLH